MPAPRVETGLATSTDHNALATYVDDTRVGILARGRRTTTSTGTTTEVGVLRIDDVPIVGGYVHRIWSSALFPDSSLVNDVMRAQVRYTSDGSTPTTSSPILLGAVGQYRQTDAAQGECVTIAATYTPAADEILSLLLTVSRVAGVGTVNLFADTAQGLVIELVVESYGIDPGDVGVDI